MAESEKVEKADEAAEEKEVVLRTFDSTPTCPKCENALDERYHDADEKPQIVMKYCDGPKPEDDCADLPKGVDHLHVTCGRCGYTWMSVCADSGTHERDDDDDDDDDDKKEGEELDRRYARGLKHGRRGAGGGVAAARED